MADYTTLANIKTRLTIGSTNAADDTFIGTLITRASAIVDSYTDNVFVKVTGTRKFDVPVRNPRRLLLDEWLLACTSVTNGNGVVIPATEYTLEDYNNPPYYAIVINRVSSYFFQPTNGFNEARAITVSGDWGFFSTCPYDVAEACEKLVVQLYRGRDGVNTGGNTVITPSAVVQTGQSLTKDITDLLDPYKRTVLSVGGWLR